MPPPPDDPAAPVLQIRLIGGFQLQRGDELLDWTTWRRATSPAMLKLLALSAQQRLSRDALIAGLWPDAPPSAGRGRLRVALHDLRRHLASGLPTGAGSYLVSIGDDVGLDPGLVVVDVRQTLAEAAALGDPGVPALHALARRLSTQLLPEDAGHDALDAARDRWAAAGRGVVLALGRAAADQGHAAAVVSTVQEWWDRDHLDEELGQLLVGLFSDTARLDLASQTLDQLRAARSELIEPAPVGDSPDDTVPFALRKLIRIPAFELPDRSATLAEVTDLLVASAAEQHLCVISGEAGAGKTTLTAQAARRVAEEGGTVLWGAAYPGEGRTPYAPLAEAIDSWLVEQPEAVRDQLVRGHHFLRAILPDQSWEAQATFARPRLAHDLASFLVEVQTNGPVLVVIEDLHDADNATLHVLHHLVRELVGTRVRVIATVREEVGQQGGSDCTWLIRALTRQGLAYRVELLGLTRRDSLSLITQTLARHVAQATSGEIEQIVHLAHGNPLFVSELVHEVARGPRPRSSPTLPSTVLDVVADRLDGTSTLLRALLSVLSMAGGPLSLPELRDVARGVQRSEPSTAQIDEAIDEGVGLRILKETEVALPTGPTEAVGFHHPVIAMAVGAELSRARQRRLHTLLAAAAQRHRPSAVATIAAHLDAAGATEATQWLLRAARHAAAVLADAEADAAFEALLRRTRSGGASAAEMAPLVIDRARVQLRLGHFRDIVSTLAALTAEVPPDHPSWVEAVQVRAQALGRLGNSAEGIHLLEQDAYRRATTSADQAMAGELVRAELQFSSGRHADALHTATEALAAAEAAGQPIRPTHRGQADQTIGATAWLLHQHDLAREATVRALTLAQQTGDVRLEVLATSSLREITLHQGEVLEALQLAERASALAARGGDPLGLAFEQVNLSLMYLRAGRADDAHDLARSCLAMARSYGRTWCLPFCLVALGEVLTGSAEQGLAPVSEVEPPARRLITEARELAVSDGERQTVWAAATLLARTDLLREDTLSATSRWHGLDGQPDPSTTLAQAEVSVRSGEAAQAREQLAIWSTGAGPEAPRHLLPAAARVRALLHLSEDEPDLARAEAREGLEFARSIGERSAARRLELLLSSLA